MEEITGEERELSNVFMSGKVYLRKDKRERKLSRKSKTMW